MKIQRVNIIKDTNHEWKGTWYKTGEKHFVVKNTNPRIINEFNAVDYSGGIDGCDCELLTGVMNWIFCAIKTLTTNKRKVS